MAKLSYILPSMPFTEDCGLAISTTLCHCCLTLMQRMLGLASKLLTPSLSTEDMTRLRSSRGYIGEVTPQAAALLVAHRGCSACNQGMMRAHTHLDPSRGPSYVVCYTARVKILFIEYDGPKVSVLFLI
jgi:hypothetical protein